MIWIAGEVRPDDGLAINAADRTFEHGLGLFETLRTWGGRPTLLDAHRARMIRSARELGLPIDPDDWPDAASVAQLLQAEPFREDRVLRITATGGGPGPSRSVVWMRTLALPPPVGDGGAKVRLGSWMVARDEPIARHKSLNYWSRRLAFEEARARGFDEVLCMTPGWVYWEASRSNLFIVQGDRLLTPSIEGPIVPGVMRGLVRDVAGEVPLKFEEVHGIESRWLWAAGEVFLTNAVRGIIPVSEGSGSFDRRWPAPGPRTRRLQALIAEKLFPGKEMP